MGYQHSGTSILARCFGSHPDAHHVPEEVPPRKVTSAWYGAETMVMKHAAVYGPNMPSWVNTGDYVKPIVITRHPMDVMASLKLRKPNLILSQQALAFRMWEAWGRFHLCPDSNVTCVRYEDLFDKDFKTICDLIEQTGLSRPDDLQAQLDATEQPIHYFEVPDEEPQRVQHEKFRSWQIHQPLVQKTDENRGELKMGELDLINDSAVFKALYPNG